jgi:hypothetical protein
VSQESSSLCQRDKTLFNISGGISNLPFTGDTRNSLLCQPKENNFSKQNWPLESSGRISKILASSGANKILVSL